MVVQDAPVADIERVAGGQLVEAGPPELHQGETSLRRRQFRVSQDVLPNR
jgi:hypothetical protein